jgi:hypothetical protein
MTSKTITCAHCGFEEDLVGLYRPRTCPACEHYHVWFRKDPEQSAAKEAIRIAIEKEVQEKRA